MMKAAPECTPVHGQIGECVVCAQELPLRVPEEGEVGVEWMCTKCSAVCYAVLVGDAPDEHRKNVRPVRFTFTESELPSPTNELISYVRRIAQIQVEDDRRESERRPYVVTVSALPLDDNLHPKGDTFKLVTKDVSSQGICVFSHRHVPHRFLALQLPVPNNTNVELQVIFEMIRQQPVGMGYEVAGPFVARIETPKP